MAKTVTALWLLVPLSALLAAVAMWSFGWAVRHRQFDDLDVEAERILLSDSNVDTPDSRHE